MGPTVAVGELVSLPMNNGSSLDNEEEVAGENSGLSCEHIAASTDYDCRDSWTIVKRAGVCISQTGSVTGGGNTKGVNSEGRMLSISSTIRSHSFGSTLGGIVEIGRKTRSGILILKKTLESEIFCAFFCLVGLKCVSVVI